MQNYEDFDTPIETSLDRQGKKLDGFDIHKRTGWDPTTATIVLSVPEPRKSAFAVQHPLFYKPGYRIVVNVIKASKAEFEKEEERLKYARIEYARLELALEHSKKWNHDYSQSVFSDRSLEIIEEMNRINKTLFNNSVHTEHAGIRAIESYKGLKNILVLDRMLAYPTFPGAICGRIIEYTKCLADARLADLPEHKWHIPESPTENLGKLIKSTPIRNIA